MRRLIFILCLLPSLAFGFKGTFNYSKITVLAAGSDGFTLDQAVSNELHGALQISHSSITIGKKNYRLTATDDRTIYKIKGGMIKFDFDENRELAAVTVMQFNHRCRFERAPGPRRAL